MLTRSHSVLAGALAVALCTVAAKGAPGLWLDVPYIHQQRDGCGSASLAMVMRYWQKKDFPIADERINPGRIQRELYAAKPRGIYARDMEKYLRESGFQVFAFQGAWSDLDSHIAKGRPLIAGLKPKGGAAHYLVIVGVEPEEAAVLVNDPERGKLLRMEHAEFAKAWQGTGNWTLLAVPHHPE